MELIRVRQIDSHSRMYETRKIIAFRVVINAAKKFAVLRVGMRPYEAKNQWRIRHVNSPYSI